MREFKEMNVKSSTWEMNKKGAHEIDQLARQAEKFYQKRVQIEVQYLQVQTSPLEETSKGTVFNKVLGSILAVIRRLSGKKLSLKTDGLGGVHVA